MQSPANKQQVLEWVGTAVNALEALIAGLPDTRLAESGVAGTWSTKDILAHITWWQLRMLGKLNGESPAFGLPGEDDEAAIQRINDEVYSAHRNQPAAEVRAAFLAANRLVQEKVAGYSEEFLLAHVEDVAADTWGHFGEHRQSIEAWLARV